MQRGALSDLDTFLVVAEHLSFRAAAERLELTAPAISHSIRQLETRLGVRLLNRTTRSVSLTEMGVGWSTGCGLHSIRSPAPLRT
jgi:DNA-binding transcriptional LysR family regulator